MTDERHRAEICFSWGEAVDYANFIAGNGWSRSKPQVKREDPSQLWSVTWEPR